MLEKAKDFIRSQAYLHSLEVIAEKEISYGVQLMLTNVNSSFEDGLPLNIYYSKKKGVSFVVGGSGKSPYHKDLVMLVNKAKMAAYTGFDPDKKIKSAKTQTKLHNWSKWIGTDESGKGDFFGPLVAAGFCCDKTIYDDLLKVGVMDSKKLKGKQIEKLAHLLHSKYRSRIEIISLTPERYNKLYADFNSAQKKLNEMMAWMHSRIILNLAQKFPVEGALIDKFTSDQKIRSSLKDMRHISLVQFPKAEQDLAVAAASIIARYHFIQGLSTLSKRFAVDLPKGANSLVVERGKEFVKRHSREQLHKVCKIHFKTYSQVLND